MAGRSWEDMNIPDAWTATSMLRSMVADHLGPNKAFEGALDDEARERMVGLVVMGHIELADKVAGLLQIVQQMLGAPPEDD
jgi:hypothetical protein